ncbi:uncharacterized protein LY89DRAFT_776109 [Mollisia scopiformis]|uniref:Antifreeze protein n=1 Tax=Mollisia scopiformis TaxID=149040 RepID=A0A194XW04_MOLSC|nr:uncharacterized protein LY89DRAFT_776109 [Mollisia scopiformis]KUJ23897.1 hypothetical protein LY89DRAFT_776109 [Mollisia scopiformis]
MQTTLFLLGLATSALANVMERQATCNADNCLRGLRGTANMVPPLSSRLDDCSSFQLATVTPAPTTITTTVATETITVTEAAVTARAILPRQETVYPSSIPAYATYCPVSSRYASACSCLGVTATTTTVGTPTVTISTTATATVTYTPNLYACSPADSASACGGSCDGTCFPDVNGVGYCKQNRPCEGLTPCTADSDCPSDICLVNGCGTVCAETQYLCPNTSSAKFLFRKKSEGMEAGKRAMVATEKGMMEMDDI